VQFVERRIEHDLGHKPMVVEVETLEERQVRKRRARSGTVS
jgi:hypothetical protein